MRVEVHEAVGKAIPVASSRSIAPALVDAVRAGDADAFAAFVEQRLPETLRIVSAILGDHADACDTTQEIFVRVWRSLPQLRDDKRFEAWFNRIVVNTARNAIRDRGRRRVREIRIDAVGSSDDGPGGARVQPWLVTLAADASLDQVDLVRRALARISPADRTLLALHHFQHLSLEAIGEALGVPPKTVKSRLFSARRALERALQEQDR